MARKDVWHPHTVDIEGYLEWNVLKAKWYPLGGDHEADFEYVNEYTHIPHHRCSKEDRKQFYEQTEVDQSFLIN